MIKLTVTTPAPLSEEEQQKLAASFNAQYKEKVAVEYRTDSSLTDNLIVFDGKDESSFTKLTVISALDLTPAQKQKVEDTFRKNTRAAFWRNISWTIRSSAGSSYSTAGRCTTDR